MNVIYSGCIPDPWLEVAKKLQKEYNLNPVYWIGWPQYDKTIDIQSEININFKSCVFHDLRLAWKAIFPDSVRNIPAIELDAEIIDKIASYELIAMKMMDRLDSDGVSFSFDERQRHFRKLLTKWLGIIEVLNLDLFISPSVPHRVFDYALYVACKIKGVRTLIYKLTPFQDVLVLIDDLDHMPIAILDDYSKIKDNELSVILPEEIVISINKLKDNYDEAEPEYMKLQKKALDNSSISDIFNKISKKGLKSINLFQLYKQTLQYHKVPGKKMEEVFLNRYQSNILTLKGRNYKNKLKKHYEGLCTKIETENEEFVFVALHYQPEETTSPSAGHYVNQYIIIALIAETLPDDVSIFVKEHSSQFHPDMEGHTGRKKTFYDDLLKIPKVKFISSLESSFDYIDHSIAVVSATGTIGWEAIVREKPVLIFGNAWYEYCDNVFRIYSKNDLKKAFSKIFSNNLQSSDYISYAKAIYKNSVFAYHYVGYDKKSKIDKDNSILNLSESINNYLENH